MDVVTTGEALVAMISEGGLALPVADRFVRTVVGAESNVAVGLARLGHSVGFVGRVGDDAHGDVVTKTLRAEAIDVSALCRDPQRPTGLLIRDAPPGRPVTVSYHRAGSAGSALQASDIPFEQVSQARLLHVSGITAMLSESATAAVHAAVDAARTAGVHVSLDPNVRRTLAPAQRWAETLRTLLPLADTVLVGADELDVTGDVDALLAAGPSTVVVKNGAEGAAEHTVAGVRTVAARPVPVVDPVGAGDAFAAGWISGWLDGIDPQERLQRAAAVASCVVAALGDIAGLPDRRTLDTLASKGPDVHR